MVMTGALAKALEGLGLEPGRTYRATVDGNEVELRVLEKATRGPSVLDSDDESSILPSFPRPGKGTCVKARISGRRLPDLSALPEE